MAEAKQKPRAGRVAALVIGALLLVAIPYGWAVFGTYRVFSEYVRRTLDDPEAPPAWKLRVHSPEECVAAGIAWAAACPGEDVFCEGGFRRVVRECMGGEDRGEWCGAQAGAWATTSFGFEACATFAAEAADPAGVEAVEDFCPTAYRVVADVCKRAALPRGASVGSGPGQ